MVGIDMVNIKRIAQIKHKAMFVARVLNEQEQTTYASFSNEARQNEWLAGRFALKEAIIKAMHVSIFMKDITIQSSNNKLFFVHDDCVLDLSLSHDQEYAIAIAVRR